MTITATAIIPAAGIGSRMNLDYPKQYHELSGAPILIHTIRAFTCSSYVKQIIVVVSADMIEDTKSLFDSYGLFGVELVVGGKRRQDSVFNGLQKVNESISIAAVHDGARPLIQPQLIDLCIEAADKHGAAIAAVPVKDTLKQEDEKGFIKATISRDQLWQAQTPQAVEVSLLKKGYQKIEGRDMTDEAGLLESAGIPVKLVEGSETNIKITRPDDLIIAEKILENKVIPDIRVGHGFDVHSFAPDRKLILGGVEIEYESGLAGHSDADVLTHALCDALLGAAGLGDIGKHFPDTDQKFKDIYSIHLLEEVIKDLEKLDFSIGNIDITVICQAPKLAGYMEKMKEVLAQACKTESSRINIKATTTEKLGYLGRKEGIASHAVITLQKKV